MSTIKTLESHTADMLRDALGEMNTATITQVLPMSEVHPNEGLLARDYLVIYEETPQTVMLDSKQEAAAWVDENLAPATVKQKVLILDNRHNKYQAFEAHVASALWGVKSGSGPERAAAVADYLNNVTAAIAQLQEVQAALAAGNFTQVPVT